MDMTLEFMVDMTSPIIGMTLKEIEKDYDIRVVNARKGISENNVRYPNSNIPVEPFDYIKVVGEYKKISNFGLLSCPEFGLENIDSD